MTYLAGCGLQSCPMLLVKGYPDIGWNPIEGERYLSFLRFAVFVNGVLRFIVPNLLLLSNMMNKRLLYKDNTDMHRAAWMIAIVFFRWERRGECQCGGKVVDQTSGVLWPCSEGRGGTRSVGCHAGGHQDLWGPCSRSAQPAGRRSSCVRSH